MAKELDLLLDYERARRDIKRLGDEIGKSTEGMNAYGHYQKKCTRIGDRQCFELLWNWNTKHREYDRWNNSHCGYEEMDEPELPEGEEPPELCEFCKITQSLVDQRKTAKKRFGVAKMRISRFAADHLKRSV